MGDHSWEESVATFTVAPLNLMYGFGRLFSGTHHRILSLVNSIRQSGQPVAHK